MTSKDSVYWIVESEQTIWLYYAVRPKRCRISLGARYKNEAQFHNQGNSLYQIVLLLPPNECVHISNMIA